MSAFREPPETPPRPETQWLGNAAVYERNRRSCADLAARLEAQGDHEKAATFRRAAAQWRRDRDEEQRRMLSRARWSGVYRRRRYGGLL